MRAVARSKRAEAERLTKILDLLEGGHPPPQPGLVYGDPWQMLVATVLSAQCTDKRVNLVTPALFARFPQPRDFAAAGLPEMEEAIRSIGLFRNKAKNLVALARILEERHGGRVPPDREALESLPGVGRKTASVVLAQAFSVPAFAVDTHIGRVCWRLGFATSKDPVEVERKITPLLPASRWAGAHLLLIRHGREVCHARTPGCPACPVRELCRWPKKTAAPPAP
ncbi:MAG: endonuclease III [Deltaproteobacteria bacterium]|nr:endonuclease III [Deltaproteobacteria bacterium]